MYSLDGKSLTFFTVGAPRHLHRPGGVDGPRQDLSERHFRRLFANFVLVKFFRPILCHSWCEGYKWEFCVKSNPILDRSCPKSTFVQCGCCQLSVSLASIMEENMSGSSELFWCRAMLSVWKQTYHIIFFQFQNFIYKFCIKKTYISELNLQILSTISYKNLIILDPKSTYVSMFWRIQLEKTGQVPDIFTCPSGNKWRSRKSDVR